jgi:CSLREA domain-containing protein
MNRFIARSTFRNATSSIFSGILAIAIVGYFVAMPPSASTMTTITVNSTDDSVDATPGDGTCADSLNRCTLRAAVMEANALVGPDTISVPAGTYTLTLGPSDDEFNFDGAREDIGDLDVLNDDLTINGAGAATTIIDGGGIDRIFDVNNFSAFGAGVNFTLNGVTLRNGNAPTSPEGYRQPGGAIQFDGSGATPTLTIDNSKITNNTAAGIGGGVLALFGTLVVNGTEVSSNRSLNSSGGGILYEAGSASGSRSLQVTNSTFSQNQAPNATFGNGGAISTSGNANITIENNSFSGNTAGANGGAISADAFLASNTKGINKNKFENNSAAQGGAFFNRNGALTFTLNAVVGNTASADTTGSGVKQSTPGSVTSIANNWWGCNQGPGFSPCDRASGPLGFGVTQWLKLNHTATPNTVLINQSTTLQADFFTNNLGSAIAASDLVALNGRTVTFNNAVLGTISGADPSISGGKVNATFTAGSTGGNGSADATVDSATVTASITINQPASVATNPTDQSVCDGGTATFTASSNGFPTPTVQWQVSTGGPFTDIPGATSTTLMFTATTADNGNQYRAVFTNSSGTATSTAATLTVVVTVTTDPSDQSVCQGSTASFSTTASGIGPFSFVWKKGATILNTGDLGGRVTITSGSNSSTLLISNVQASDAGTYSVETTGTCGTATQSASLTLDSTPPSITCPANVTVEATCPSGAIATYTAPVGTDNCPGVTTSRTAGQASGSVFPIGSSTVTYTATDASGNSTSCSFTVTVLTPQAVIQNLIASVSASSLNGTQKNGLLSKLNAALSAINNGQTNVACNKLSEFINSVGSLVSHGDITAAQGQSWIDSANHVRNTIGCTNLGCT